MNETLLAHQSSCADTLAWAKAKLGKGHNFVPIRLLSFICKQATLHQSEHKIRDQYQFTKQKKAEFAKATQEPRLNFRLYKTSSMIHYKEKYPTLCSPDKNQTIYNLPNPETKQSKQDV